MSNKINNPVIIHKSWKENLLQDDGINNMEQVFEVESQILNDINGENVLPRLHNRDVIFKHLSLDLDKFDVFIFNEKPYDYTVDNVDFNTGFAWGNARDASTEELDIITKEIETSLNGNLFNFDYKLEHWLEQGIMAINICGTTQEYDNKSNSHIKYWKEYSQYLIEYISRYKATRFECCVFVFCGQIPQLFSNLVDETFHNIIEVESPTRERFSLYEKFLGSDLFNEINAQISYCGRKTDIDWENKTLGDVFGYGQYPENWD